jgi:hypothetical protein
MHPRHLNRSAHAVRTCAVALTDTHDSHTARRRGVRGSLVGAILSAVVTALVAACEPNPNPNPNPSPVPRVPTPTPEPNRNPEQPMNPKTVSVTSTQILVDSTVSCKTHRRLSV